MTTPKKRYQASFLKEETSKIFSQFFRQKVFNDKLSFGCRIWLLSTATFGHKKPPKVSKQAKKLGVLPGQIYRWQGEAQIKAGKNIAKNT